MKIALICTILVAVLAIGIMAFVCFILNGELKRKNKIANWYDGIVWKWLPDEDDEEYPSLFFIPTTSDGEKILEVYVYFDDIWHEISSVQYESIKKGFGELRGKKNE